MNHRIARHEFACSAISSAFRVVGFTGTEAISQPYRFEIELVSDDPEIDFSDVIDQPATLTMYRGDDPSEVDGIVTSLQQLHQTGAQSEFRYGYRAVLEPRLSRLTFSMQSRVFQNRTVEEIVTQILDEAGVDVEFDLKGSYAPREYTTQYKETDLAFVQRLLEFEGIHYAFRHEDGAETLVVSDDAKSATPIEGDPEIAYSHADGLRPSDSLETIRDFVLEQRLVTGMTRVKDYNYRTPEANVFSENELEAKGSTGVHSDYGVHAKDTDAADRLSKIRAEEIESQRVTVTGTGDCLRFRAGQTFSLRDHYRDGLNQTYLITSVQHTGAQPDTAEASVADEALPNYSNAFTCIPASAPFRPPRLTPEPKLPGVMTAKVESGGGDYAYIDDEGRYRVKMPFDLADAEAGGASKPIRLAQPYTGAGYGMHFPVHADAEMVFACVDGNVDRPLGLSTVPNPSQGSPVASGNRTMNRIVTAADNRIEIEDEAGNERIKLYSPAGNSIVQLGSPNLPTLGIGIDTEKTAQMHGGEGLVLMGGGGYVPDDWIGEYKTALTAFDGVLGAVRVVAGGVASGCSRLAITGGIAATAASTSAGIVGPGAYLYGAAGIGMYSPNSVNAFAGAGGMGLHSTGGTDLFAARGISIMNAFMGISILNQSGGIGIVTGTGGIAVKAKAGDIKLDTETNKIQLNSKSNIEAKTDRDFVLTSSGNYSETVSGKKEGLYDNGLKFDSRGNTIEINPNSRSIELNSENSIDIVSKGMTDIVSNGSLDLAAKRTMSLKISQPMGPSITINGSTIEMKSGANTITLSPSGVKIEGISVEVKGQALAKLKAALAQVN